MNALSFLELNLIKFKKARKKKNWIGYTLQKPSKRSLINGEDTIYLQLTDSLLMLIGRLTVSK